MSRLQSDIRRLDDVVESWERALRAQYQSTVAIEGLRGADLHRLTDHQAMLRRELDRVPPIRAKLLESLNAQRQRVLHQERKRKTLSRLREKQRDEWLAAERTKEIELASELFLASLARASATR